MKLFNVAIRISREKCTAYRQQVTSHVEGKTQNKRVLVVSRIQAL